MADVIETVDTENQNDRKLDSSTANLVEEANSNNNYKLDLFNSTLNLLAHLCAGAVTFVGCFYAFQRGLPLNPTMIHIVLCMIGYQLLMAEAILSLSPHNGWTARLRLGDKRKVHAILQILGSGLAIAGTVIMCMEKTVNFNTLHGQFALVAFVFTTVSFVNGITSQYAFNLRKIIPPNLSKLTHICFGVVAFAAANISLCYGFDKIMFRIWMADGLVATTIALTAALTAIVIVNPAVVFTMKFLGMFK